MNRIAPTLSIRLAFLLFAFAGNNLMAQPAAPDTRFTPPPGEETAEIRALIDRARAAFDSGRTVTSVLTDDAFQPVRAWPRFRGLIKDRAATGLVTLTPSSEPGEPMHVRGTVRDAGGRAVAGALVYVYQTSAKGWYSDKAAHISGNSGDTRHARLFAYLRTDAEGGYEFRTIRPAGYPATDLPAHIHIEIQAGGGSRVTEIVFEDDPRLTPAWRERSENEGFSVATVSRGADGAQQIVVDFALR